jgi:hypothetical protein
MFAAICYIDKYKNMVTNEDDEFCGVLIYNKNNNCYEDEYKPIRGKTVMINNKPVKNCQIPKYEDIIWHSHPIVSKSYPSGIDIYKLIEHNSIKISIIFTNWGVWQIRYKNYYSGNPPDKKSTILELDKHGHDLYVLERGRKLVLDDEDVELINSYISKLMRIYGGLYIQFDLWGNIYHDTYVIKA